MQARRGTNDGKAKENERKEDPGRDERKLDLSLHYYTIATSRTWKLYP